VQVDAKQLQYDVTRSTSVELTQLPVVQSRPVEVQEVNVG